jgi:hypothetical protein
LHSMVATTVNIPETNQSVSLSEEEIAAMIAAVMDGSMEVPPGVSVEDAVAVLLQELPDAPPPEVTDAVARLVVEDS